MRANLLGAALALVAFPACAEPNLQQTVGAFLNAYATGDKAGVIAAVDPNVQLYAGSETYKGLEGASDLFDHDRAL